MVRNYHITAVTQQSIFKYLILSGWRLEQMGELWFHSFHSCETLKYLLCVVIVTILRHRSVNKENNNWLLPMNMQKEHSLMKL